jgi:hypothetical protein
MMIRQALSLRNHRRLGDRFQLNRIKRSELFDSEKEFKSSISDGIGSVTAI